MLRSQNIYIHPDIFKDMEVKKMTVGIILSLVFIIVVGAVFALAETNTEKSWSFQGKHHKMGFASQLTEEQMITLHETKMELREQGASWEEMRDAMKELYEEWGIESPDWSGKLRSGFGRHHMNGKSFGEGYSHFKGILSSE